MNYNKHQESIDLKSYIWERIVYIDYGKNSGLKKRIMMYEDIIRNLILKKECPHYYYKREICSKEPNPFPELNSIYVDIKMLKNEYVIFMPTIYNYFMITDSLYYIVEMGMLDPFRYRFGSLVNDSYEFDLCVDYTDKNDIAVKNIILKKIDSKNNIYVKKESLNDRFFYSLCIPLKNISPFPILNIINTDCIDYEYDFDTINFEKYFN